jgi:hypothetical protein
MFNQEPYNREKTIEWIQSLQKDKMYAIQGVFYRVNILNLFNEEIPVPVSYINKLKSKTKFANFEVAYYHTIISHILNLDNLANVTSWILSHQNRDGGFGLGRSDILSTFYALESLNFIDPSLIKMDDNIMEFVQNCLTVDGGFTFIPDIYPPYIEPTWAGIKICEILNKNPLQSDKTINCIKSSKKKWWIPKNQNINGISELENTIKSLRTLKSLKYVKKITK